MPSSLHASPPDAVCNEYELMVQKKLNALRMQGLQIGAFFRSDIPISVIKHCAFPPIFGLTGGTIHLTGTLWIFEPLADSHRQGPCVYGRHSNQRVG